MNCPGCSEALPAGQDRCPACGVALAAPVLGALAPELLPLVDTPLERPERQREVPAFRKREPSWRDEVRERIKHRKRHAQPDELPLFRDEPGPGEVALERDPAETAPQPPDAGAPIEAPELERMHRAAADALPADVVDLPLRPTEALSAERPVANEVAAPPPAPAPAVGIVELGEPEKAAPATGWTLDEPEQRVPVPVERPALLGERAQAATLDLTMLGATALLVVYFSARAARVPLAGLLPAWPWIAAFVALFGLVYASFFTGLTGQTLGKMVFRLRVVDRAGAPPGHLRAALRALLGALGALLLVGVAPAFVDPARRAFHDRLLRTRVIRN